MKPRFDRLEPCELILETDQIQQDNNWLKVANRPELMALVGQPVGERAVRRQVHFKKISKSDQAK